MTFPFVCVCRIDPSQEKDLDRAIQTAFKTFAGASNETGLLSPAVHTPSHVADVGFFVLALDRQNSEDDAGLTIHVVGGQSLRSQQNLIRPPWRRR